MNEVELKVKQVFESQSKVGAYVLLLEKLDETDKQQIPIIVGEKEAYSIYCSLNQIPNLRPLTHDLMTTCIQFLDGNLTRVVIYKVEGGIYYSHIYLNKENQFTRVDSRTSDAIALALRFDVPIFIDQEILEAENIEVVLDVDQVMLSDEPKPLTPSKEDLQNQLDKAISQEDYELASVLRDQIAELE